MVSVSLAQMLHLDMLLHVRTLDPNAGTVFCLIVYAIHKNSRCITIFQDSLNTSQQLLAALLSSVLDNELAALKQL